VQAEQSVLGAMLLSKDAIGDVAEVVRGRDFYLPKHEQIYEAVIDLFGRGEPADAITVADELAKRGELGKIGGHIYLHDLLSMVSIASNASYYAEIVKEKAILRRLVEASIKISQMGYAGGGEVAAAVDAVAPRRRALAIAQSIGRFRGDLDRARRAGMHLQRDRGRIDARLHHRAVAEMFHHRERRVLHARLRGHGDGRGDRDGQHPPLRLHHGELRQERLRPA